MIVTNDMYKSTITDLANKDTKIGREIKEGKLIKIKNGLYETDPNTPGYLLAGSIYGPSYLSFDFALSYYGLIPERVVNYTCATYEKKKKKIYSNSFGTFLYRDVPKSVYPLGVILKNEAGYTYQLATKEKALCDKLYTLKPIRNLSELAYMLFNDLRIDKEELFTLNRDMISELSSRYHCKNVELLSKYMRRKIDE